MKICSPHQSPERGGIFKYLTRPDPSVEASANGNAQKTFLQGNVAGSSSSV